MESDTFRTSGNVYTRSVTKFNNYTNARKTLSSDFCEHNFI